MAGKGVAMKNARDTLKAIADEITEYGNDEVRPVIISRIIHLSSLQTMLLCAAGWCHENATAIRSSRETIDNKDILADPSIKSVP